MNIVIKTTKIKNRWHARLIVDDKIFDEMACSFREDIGWICREMLRWLDKTGGNQFSSAARKRHITPAKGNIWYKNQLQK